jgi:hypothetical protein
MARLIRGGLVVWCIVLALAACAAAPTTYAVGLADIDPGQPYRTLVGDLSVAILLSGDRREVSVLLLRDTHSSHSGLAWMAADQRFVSPRTGSTFAADGSYILGPAPRDLDRLAAAISGDVVIVDTSKVYRGRRHN